VDNGDRVRAYSCVVICTGLCVLLHRNLPCLSWILSYLALCYLTSSRSITQTYVLNLFFLGKRHALNLNVLTHFIFLVCFKWVSQSTNNCCKYIIKSKKIGKHSISLNTLSFFLVTYHLEIERDKRESYDRYDMFVM
jgi:hypothetical protein